jgi:hypothetical protein
LANWLANFATLLTANPPLYGQTSGVAASVQASNDAWQAAYAKVTSPSTKTPDTVGAKNSQTVSTLAIVRPVAQQISLNAAVATSDKIAIGVNPRTSTPQPITPPSTYPALSIRGGAHLQLYVQYRDSAATPSVKSKPYGVQSVQFAFVTSATPITDVTLLTRRVALTKSPYLLQLDSADGGKQLYFAAQYLLKNGKTSGWSPIGNFTVPTGS